MRYDQRGKSSKRTTDAAFTTKQITKEDIDRAVWEVAKITENARKQQKLLCSMCDYTGAVIAIKKGTNYRYSFRCTACTASEKLLNPENVPAWDLKYLHEFSPLMYGLSMDEYVKASEVVKNEAETSAPQVEVVVVDESARHDPLPF